MAANDLKKMKWKLFLLGFFKIPVIYFLRPKLLRVDDEGAEVRIKLRRRSKNHLNSMYFGALAVGADVAGGILAFYFAEKSGLKISFAFKAVEGEFLKRATSDIVFKCDEGALIQQIVEESKHSGERVNRKVTVLAYNCDNEIVADFKMTLSVKVK